MKPTTLTVSLILALITCPLIAQDDLDSVFRQPPEPGTPMVDDVAADTPIAAASDRFDITYSLLSTGRPTAYRVTPETTPAMLRSLVLRNAALGQTCLFGSALADGSPVTAQPYWEHSKGLATVRARAMAMLDAGRRLPQVAVLVPWLDATEATDSQKAALRNVADYLTSIQVGYTVVAGDDLAAIEAGDAKAIFLPQAAIAGQPQVDVIRRALEAGVKVIATHDLPQGPEGGDGWVQESFGVASIDDVEDPLLQKGNAIFVPAELHRLNPILNGIRCEDLFLYPPSGRVVSAHFVSNDGGDIDWYLLYNTDSFACHTYLTLYRRCAPEIWDLDTGKIRLVPGYKHTEDETTLVPLVLEPEDAIILLCKPAPAADRDTHIAQAPGLEKVEMVERDGKAIVRGLARLNGTHTVMLADGRKGKAEVDGLPPELVVDGAWSFSTAEPVNRKPTLISRARARAASEGEDIAQWPAADFDDTIWDLAKIGDPLPSLAPKWHAKWLQYSGDGEVRYFRKTFELTQAATAATVSSTADNGYELYVNGEKTGEDGDWYQAETYDIAEKLKQGSNVIAIRTDNQGSAAGLLCEARVTLANGDLLRLATDATWRMTADPGDGWQTADFDDSGWGDPEVGGSPPSASPWGDVTGLPPEPQTGTQIWYRFDLPPGAARLRLQEGAEAVALYVGGEGLPLSGSTIELPDVEGTPRVALVVAGPDALSQPIECESDAGQILAGDWKTQGLTGYAGEATYERTLPLPPEYVKERLFLDLGDVGVCARVSVNGQDLGPRSRPPYVFDLDGHVRKPKTRLKIAVANTLAAEDPETEAPAGLIGPITIRPYREVEVVPE